MERTDAFIHSHSGLEKTLHDKDIANKSHVLVDEIYEEFFTEHLPKIKRLRVGEVTYLKIPILTFVRCGGVFRAFES